MKAICPVCHGPIDLVDGALAAHHAWTHPGTSAVRCPGAGRSPRGEPPPRQASATAGPGPVDDLGDAVTGTIETVPPGYVLVRARCRRGADELVLLPASVLRDVHGDPVAP